MRFMTLLLVLLLPSVAFAQLPQTGGSTTMGHPYNPRPYSPYNPQPYYPGNQGGDYLSPRSWGDFAAQIGLPAFFAVVFFAALAWLWWRQQNRPSNRDQVRLLKLMYRDAMERNLRIRRVLRAFCDVCIIFAAKSGVDADVRNKLDKVEDALDAGPPPVPEELSLDDDEEERRHAK